MSDLFLIDEIISEINSNDYILDSNNNFHKAKYLGTNGLPDVSSAVPNTHSQTRLVMSGVRSIKTECT